jgi:hypothetical protein
MLSFRDRVHPVDQGAHFEEDEAMVWNSSALNSYPAVHASRWQPGEKDEAPPFSTDWIDWIPYVTAEAVDAAFYEVLHACLGFRRASR